MMSALLLFCCLAQAEVTQGKLTDAQVVALGQEKWLARVSKQIPGGITEPATRSALRIYGEAATRENDRAFSRLSRTQAERFRKLRKALTDYSYSFAEFEMGSGFTGTLAITISSGYVPNIEDLIARLRVNRPQPGGSMVVSTVERVIDRVEGGYRRGLPSERGDEITRFITSARRQYKTQIVPIAAQFPRKSSDDILRVTMNLTGCARED
jgi:hypothetical protein